MPGDQPRGEDADPTGKSLTAMPAPSSQMIPNPANLSWNPDSFLSWDSTNPLSWNNPKRHSDGTRQDGLYEKSTKALDASAPGLGMTDAVDMIQRSVPLSWPQDNPISWTRPERDADGKRKDGLYENSTVGLAPPAPGAEPVTMINPPVPMSFPQDEPLSWNAPERDAEGRRKDGLFEERTALIDRPVPLSWPQTEPLSWNREERKEEEERRSERLYETGTQMINKAVPLSWDQGRMLSWDAEMFMSEENLKKGIGHVGIGQDNY